MEPMRALVSEALRRKAQGSPGPPLENTLNHQGVDSLQLQESLQIKLIIHDSPHQPLKNFHIGARSERNLNFRGTVGFCQRTIKIQHSRLTGDETFLQTILLQLLSLKKVHRTGLKLHIYSDSTVGQKWKNSVITIMGKSGNYEFQEPFCSNFFFTKMLILDFKAICVMV